MTPIYIIKKIRPAAVFILLIIAYACGQNEPPLITTDAVTGITHIEATGGGNVIDDGGREVSFRGLVWSTDPRPDVDSHIGMTEEGEGTGMFSSRMTGLTPGTTYYVRAYAVNRVGTSYGDPFEFTTEPPTPDVAPAEMIETGPTGATARGFIADDRGHAVTARGIVWSREPDPTVEVNEGITTDGEGTGAFESSVTGLQPGTDYFLRTYATSRAGTAYSRETRFATAPPERPVAGTADITSVRSYSAISGGTVYRDGGAPVTARGVVAGTREAPTTDNYVIITRDGRGLGSFTSVISGLTPGTPYFIRAWATNIAGTAYGRQLTLTTPEPVPPVVSSAVVSDIEASSATGYVSVREDGGVDVTSRGFVWDRKENPTLEVNEGMAVVGEGTGDFSVEMEGLQPGATYYMRAFATNEAGTAYSEQTQFRTRVRLPAVTTVSMRGYTDVSAVFSNRVTDDGGEDETFRGMVIASFENPDVDKNEGITYNGYGRGDFTSQFAGLKPGTTYYARAYASNAAGVTYGRQARFTTIAECGEEVTFTYKGETVTYGTVEGHDGTCWMDRNLGASQVAVSRRDAEAFGDLYQWGRLDDGHQERDSDSISVLSASDQPGHGNFIVAISSPYDWRDPQNDHLWQGDGGINDVCPVGWRLPAGEEWDDEAESWERQNRRGAFESPLKLPAAGLRSNTYKPFDFGRRGYYWTSGAEDIFSELMIITRRSAMVNLSSRAGSRSIRCIREELRTDVEWLP